MTTPTPEAIEAALDAVRAIDGPASIGSEEVVTAALTAAAPFIAAQALREAADALESAYPKSHTRFNEGYRAAASVLRARAATIEGKSE